MHEHSFPTRRSSDLFQVGSIAYEWEEKPDFYDCKRVFVEAFTKCYDSIPLDVLHQPSRSMMVQWLGDAFDGFYTTFEKGESDLYWLVAKENKEVTGFLVINLDKLPEEIYLAQMAIDPSYQRLGIATNLVKCLLDQFPEAKRLVVITRIANEEAKNFYQAMGFVKSDYMHEGYSREFFTGFEYKNHSGQSLN
jgi:ribosomal protein S18 acetylase RimI-like enzyme